MPISGSIPPENIFLNMQWIESGLKNGRRQLSTMGWSARWVMYWLVRHKKKKSSNTRGLAFSNRKTVTNRWLLTDISSPLPGSSPTAVTTNDNKKSGESCVLGSSAFHRAITLHRSSCSRRVSNPSKKTNRQWALGSRRKTYLPFSRP